MSNEEIIKALVEAHYSTTVSYNQTLSFLEQLFYDSQKQYQELVREYHANLMNVRRHREQNKQILEDIERILEEISNV